MSAETGDSMRNIPVLMLFCLLTTPGAVRAGDTLLSMPWGTAFTVRVTDDGDSVSIGSLYSRGGQILVYSLADGRMTTIDSSGSIVETVKPASVGRLTYLGDDFVVRDTELVFLNSVDKRLEFFGLHGGSHLRARPIPNDLLASEPTRSRRVLSRVFLLNKTVYVGNEHVAVPLDNSLSKQAVSLKVLRSRGSERIALASDSSNLYLSGSTIRGSGCAKCRIPSTHFGTTGKRFVTIAGKPYAAVLGRSSFSIVKVH